MPFPLPWTITKDGKLVIDIKGDADTVDGVHAAATPTANKLLAMNANAKFPTHTVEGDLTVEGTFINTRTRTFLVQAIAAYNGTDAVDIVLGAWTLGWPLPDAKASRATGGFYVPSDFVSDLVIEGAVYPWAAGDLYGAIYAFGAADGEVYNTHSTVPDKAAVTLAASKWDLVYPTEIDGVAIGDFVRLELHRDATNAADTISHTVAVAGFLVSYTVDS